MRVSAIEQQLLIVENLDRLGISDCADAILRIRKKSKPFALGLPILLGAGTAKNVLSSAVREIHNAQRGQIKADLDFLTKRLNELRSQQ